MRRGIVIDFGHEGAIQVYASDRVPGSAAADPADRGPGEGERGLRSRRIGGRDSPVAPGVIPVIEIPRAGVSDGPIRVVEARSQARHVERIDYDLGPRRSTVLEARHLDRQRMARIGQSGRREDVVHDSLRWRIRIHFAYEAAVEVYAGGPAVGPAVANPADRCSVEAQRGLRARRRRNSGVIATPRLACIQPYPSASVGHRWIRLLQARHRRSRHVERIHDDQGVTASLFFSPVTSTVNVWLLLLR